MAQDGIAISAYYYPQMDGVEIQWCLMVDNDKVAPVDIKSAQAQLLRGEAILQETALLTKFHANEDFYFRALFLHPAAIEGLAIEVQITTRDDTVWRKRVGVVQGEVGAEDASFAANSVNLVDK